MKSSLDAKVTVGQKPTIRGVNVAVAESASRSLSIGGEIAKIASHYQLMGFARGRQTLPGVAWTLLSLYLQPIGPPSGVTLGETF